MHTHIHLRPLIHNKMNRIKRLEMDWRSENNASNGNTMWRQRNLHHFRCSGRETRNFNFLIYIQTISFSFFVLLFSCQLIKKKMNSVVEHLRTRSSKVADKYNCLSVNCYLFISVVRNCTYNYKQCVTIWLVHNYYSN